MDNFTPSPSPSRSPSPRAEHAQLPPHIPASHLRKLVAVELAAAGFDAASPEALDELHGIVLTFFASLLQRSHQLAEHARRTKPTLKDIVTACQDLGVGGSQELVEETYRERMVRITSDDFALKYDREKVVDVLQTLESDDDEEQEDQAALIAPYLPPLPPKHSYKQTPVFPTPAHHSLIPPPPPSSVQLQAASPAALAHLATLHARFHNSQLVANSLRHLVRGAQEGDEDVVDYELEWYGAAEAPKRTKAKRAIRVLKVGQTSGSVAQDDESTRTRGGVVKKRRWRV